MKTMLPLLVGLFAVGAAAQEGPALAPEPIIDLPVADQARPFDEKDAIVVEVFRAPGAMSAPAANEVAPDWRFRLAGKIHGPDGEGVALVWEELRALALPSVSMSERRSSERALLIRADADAPHALIATLMADAAVLRVNRLFFATRKGPDRAEQALACLLRVDSGLQTWEREAPGTRIAMKWFQQIDRRSPGRLIVSTDTWNDPAPTILESNQDLVKALSPERAKPPVIIDAESRVPWQRVVDVVNAAHSVGQNQIEFTLGAGLRRGASGAHVDLDAAKGSRAGSRIGRRNVQAGNLQETERAVMAGLAWLKRHQNPDGSWDCDGFPSVCDPSRGAPCAGRGAAVYDVGVTGLALLAFLGAGFDSQRPGVYLDTVRNGLKFLKNVQDAEGRFGPGTDNRHTYSHACATIAMCEAFGSSKQLPWRKSAEAAVAYINASQNPYKGWRYGKQPGDNDTSVTGWMLMALHAAREAGIPIDDRRVKDGLAFIDSLTDEDTGRTGYIKKGERPVRPEGAAAKWPPSESEALTALAMCARIFWKDDSPLVFAGAELLSKRLPIWDEAKGSIDMSYWYWGTLAMFQLGGERWTRWNESLKSAALDHQVQTGCAAGSWDPKDPWGDEGGRVYSTALMTLCLESYYRYRKR